MYKKILKSFFDMLKRSRRDVNRANQEQGRNGESQVKARYEMNGWKMTRTGKGHDYRATRKNWGTGKTETKYVEVKTGNSQLSDLQKKKKKQFGRKYVEERVNSHPLVCFGRDILNTNSTKPQKSTRKYSEKNLIHTIFGIPNKDSTKSKSRRKSSGGIWRSNTKSRKSKSHRSKKSKSRSNLEILLGPSKSSRKSKSRGRSNVDKIWGSSKSSRRNKSRGRSNVDKIWGSSSGSTSIW